MDEFAQSREDDDLFADEFEPVAEPTTTVEPVIEARKPKQIQQTTSRQAIPREPRGGHRNNRGQDGRRGRGGRGGGGANGTGLSQSRYAPQNEQPPPITTGSVAPPAVEAPSAEVQTEPTIDAQEISPKTPTDALTSPTQPSQPQPSGRTPAVRGDRSATGGPAHKKLTEEELAAKLAKMAILNEQKSAKHRAQEADQAAFQHREKELAKERREKLVEEKKNRSQMEAERARNRERKIQAQGVREWDSEKVEEDIVDARRARTSEYVRGAHGGVIRGRGAGLAGSRYAGSEDVREDEGYNPRGRGGFEIRGRGRGGRGGRGGKQGGPQAVPTPEDFPSLPAPTKAPETGKAQEAPKPDESVKPQTIDAPAGAWADEMATPIEEKKI